MAAQTIENAPAARERSGAGHREEPSMPEQAYKRCTKCGELKPLDEFYRNRSFGDGRQPSCKACFNITKKAYRDANPEKTKRAAERWRAANIERVRLHARVRDTVGRALRRGDLVRPEACERCGRVQRIEGHHHDYTKPLEVEWLCGYCHKAEHARLDAIQEGEQG